MRAHLSLLVFLVFALLGGCDNASSEIDDSEQAHAIEFRRLVFHLDEYTRVERVMRFDQDSLVFFNHSERIAIPYTNNDSFQSHFTLYRSAIVLNDKLDSGYWEIYDRETPYRVPITAHSIANYEAPEHKHTPDTLIYEVTFNPNTDRSYPAIGTFLRSGHYLSGTFQTETGDYRFLQGELTADSVAYLSCFDGSHLFHFQLHLNSDAITGTFSSGLSYRSKFTGVRNHDARLSDPFDLTRIVNDTPVSLDVLTTTGDSILLDSDTFYGKITLLQIMGTWCPNCLDESNYLRELYKKGLHPNLQIIGLAYERGDDPFSALPRVAHYRQKLRLPFAVHLAGKANKAMASQHFPMLSGITSFPTTIVLGPDATIRFTHTGFNGPGTGAAYEQFTQRFEAQINALLSELENGSIR